MSGRSTSSSNSSRSSKAGSRSRSPLRWRARGKNREVTPQELHELETQRFKHRGALLSYAARHPGALAASFLAEVHRRCGLGAVRQSKDLRKAPVKTWASDKTGLSDVRDLREVATLATIADHLNLDEVDKALDVVAQRVGAIQLAKMKGNSWEKAEKSELIPVGSHLVAPPGVQQLAQ